VSWGAAFCGAVSCGATEELSPASGARSPNLCQPGAAFCAGAGFCGPELSWPLATVARPTAAATPNVTILMRFMLFLYALFSPLPN
jgi:hypothetical protein